MSTTPNGNPAGSSAARVHGARRPWWPSILACAACAVLLLVAGCGNGGDAEVDVEGAQTQPTAADTGNGQGEEIPPDEGGDGKVSISVASLPFGGAAVPIGELGQCATVGWNGDIVVPDGAVMRISVGLTSDLLALDPMGCLQVDGPWCEGLEVTGKPYACNIGVIATRAPAEGEVPPSAVMSGELVCEASAAEACEQTAAALQGSVTTVQFALPEIDEPDGGETDTTG